MTLLSDLDAIIWRSLESFYLDLCAMESCGREREAVSRYAFAHLVKCCQDGTVLHDSAQIGIEVAVGQLTRCDEYPHVGKTVCKDLVIWRNPNTVLWKGNVPHFEPLAIMEWKMVHAFDRIADRPKKSESYESDIRWLGKKARSIGSEFVGYAIFIDSTCSPKKLECARVSSDGTERNWFTPSTFQMTASRLTV
jgi:hypothetical protein